MAGSYICCMPAADARLMEASRVTMSHPIGNAHMAHFCAHRLLLASIADAAYVLNTPEWKLWICRLQASQHCLGCCPTNQSAEDRR